MYRQWMFVREVYLNQVHLQRHLSNVSGGLRDILVEVLFPSEC